MSDGISTGPDLTPFQDGTLGNDARIQVAPEINDQPAGDRDNPDFPGAWSPVRKPAVIPLRQRTLSLIGEPAPGDLDRHRADASIPSFADALLVIQGATLIRRAHQPGTPTDLPAIAEPAPGKEFHHVQPRRIVTDAAQLEEPSDQRDRFIAALADHRSALSFEGVDLRRHELHLLPLPGEADPQRLGYRLPIPLGQSIEPGPKPLVHLEQHTYGGEQPRDPV